MASLLPVNFEHHLGICLFFLVTFNFPIGFSSVSVLIRQNKQWENKLNPTLKGSHPSDTNDFLL